MKRSEAMKTKTARPDLFDVHPSRKESHMNRLFDFFWLVGDLAESWVVSSLVIGGGLCLIGALLGCW